MTGVLLGDREIVDEIQSGRLIVTNPKHPLNGQVVFDKDSPVQASSLDLTIGRIMKPPTEIDEEAQSKCKVHKVKSGELHPGETFVVETNEEIGLDSSLAAFGFPPARMARNAILMTNPGHVDPGFRGKLSFTLINMGRNSFYLEEGEQIVSLLVFKFDQPVEADYASRCGPPDLETNYWPVLNKLSPDFANLNHRMSDQAAKAVTLSLAEFDQKLSDAKEKLVSAERKFDRSKLWVAAASGVIVAAIGFFGVVGVDWLITDKYTKSTVTAKLEKKVATLQKQIVKLQGAQGVSSFDDRLDNLEVQIKTLKQLRQSDPK